MRFPLTAFLRPTFNRLQTPFRFYRMASTMAPSTAGRTYADAINLLNSLQSNAAVIEAIRKGGGKSGDQLMQEMVEYLTRIGYQPADLNPLNVLHITGTKGKGSTSAFTESILRTLAPQAKTGLYTSPHMVAVRERIRINGKPIEEDVFARYFFEVWDRLERKPERKDPDTPEKPAYFRYLTILAFHVFLQEKVDATILEVGVGGTYDSTNIVPAPITTGVTSLGIDHIFVLGKTLPEIAAQKGGIYKPNVPALAIDQPAEGLDVLRSRAAELKAQSFTVVPEHPELANIKLGLAGLHQRTNASLSISLVQSFLSSPRLPSAYSSHALPHSTSDPLPSSLIAPTPLPAAIRKGLEETTWPGRCQVEKDAKVEGVTWYLDGAHTVESLKCCGEWFGEEALSKKTEASTTRTLIFNCTSGRSGASLLGTLLAALSATSGSKHPFQHVIFCTNTTYKEGSKGDLANNSISTSDLEHLTTQHELSDAWADLSATSLPTAKAEVHILASIEEAVDLVRGNGQGEAEVLVTGSLHLVGGVMEVAGLSIG
ncbi:FolC bifunctional protein [Leucosporidium creatinivorum]|uniref:Folylpolyglutamate synthase n=1 Tax=Leucosporidium creatinivorum TaxID=106004 RepID=A0A1Y2FZU3_9BASI|nr:FolC bifunctional protein [Leucosporidium creatinivorum]